MWKSRVIAAKAREPLPGNPPEKKSLAGGKEVEIVIRSWGPVFTAAATGTCIVQCKPAGKVRQEAPGMGPSWPNGVWAAPAGLQKQHEAPKPPPGPRVVDRG